MKVRVCVNSVEYSIEMEKNQTINDLIQKLKTENGIDITDKEIFYFGEDYDGETTLESLGYFEGAVIYIERGDNFSTIGAPINSNSDSTSEAEDEETKPNSNHEDEEMSDQSIFNMIGQILNRIGNEMTSTQRLLEEHEEPQPNDYIYNVKLSGELLTQRQQNLAATGTLNILSISKPELHSKLENRGINESEEEVIQATLGLKSKDGRYETVSIPFTDISMETELAMTNGVSNPTAKQALALARGNRDVAQEIINKLEPKVFHPDEID